MCLVYLTLQTSNCGGYPGIGETNLGLYWRPWIQEDSTSAWMWHSTACNLTSGAKATTRPANQLVIAAWGVAASIEVCIWGSHTVSVVPLTKKEPLPLVGEEGLGVLSSPLRMRMGQASSPETPPVCAGKGITVSHGDQCSSASITHTTDHTHDQSVYEF